MASTFETIQVIATIDTSNYDKGISRIEKGNNDIEKSANTTEKNSNAAFNGIANVGLAALAAATIAVGVAITRNIGNAVDRIDTLVNFPKILQSMGSSSSDATKATTKLSESLKGLPTSLQDGASGVQQLVAAGLDVPTATNAFLAMNNALIAGGADAADAQISMDGLVRGISAGNLPASTLQAILSRMPTVFSALQKSTGMSRDELIKLYETNPQKLIDDMIRLNTEGGGGLASLDDQARAATSGIGTSFDNLNNAVTRGIEGIIIAIGGGDLEAGQKKISDGIASLGNTFEDALNGVGSVINFIRDNQTVFGALAAAITGVVTALTAWKIATMLMAAAQAVLNAVLTANPIGIIIVAIAGLVAALIWLLAQTEIGQKIISVAWDAIKGAVESVFNWVKNNWPLILGIITGPIGTAVLLIIRNLDKIKSAFSNVWEWIKGVFGTIGSVASNIIKIPVNAIIGFAQNTINGFIRSINGMLGAINKLPGPDIGKLSEINIPKLAKGGIVTAPTLAMVGEGRESEAVIPLSKLDQMLGNNSQPNIRQINQPIIRIPNQSSSDYRQGAINTIKAYNEYLRSKGQPQIGVAT